MRLAMETPSSWNSSSHRRHEDTARRSAAMPCCGIAGAPWWVRSVLIGRVLVRIVESSFMEALPGDDVASRRCGKDRTRLF